MVLEQDSIFETPAEQLDNEIQSGVPQNRANFYFIGGDFTEGSVANSTSETEVLDFDIPKNTVVNGIKIITSCQTVDFNLNLFKTIVRIKAGTNGSEVTKATGNFRAGWGDIVNFQDYRGEVRGVVDDLDWTADQTVSITVQMDDANAGTSAIGEYLIIEGF